MERPTPPPLYPKQRTIYLSKQQRGLSVSGSLQVFYVTDQSERDFAAFLDKSGFEIHVTPDVDNPSGPGPWMPTVPVALTVAQRQALVRLWAALDTARNAIAIADLNAAREALTALGMTDLDTQP